LAKGKVLPLAKGKQRLVINVERSSENEKIGR